MRERKTKEEEKRKERKREKKEKKEKKGGEPCVREEEGKKSKKFYLSLRSTEIGPSVFVEARGKVHLRDESFA